MFRLLLRGAVLAVVLTTTAQPAVVRLGSQASSEASSIGTLVGYDTKTRVLTIRVGKEPESFVLAQKASVRLGSRVLREEEIGSHAGLKVKVRFTESGGRRVANSVMLSPMA